MKSDISDPRNRNTSHCNLPENEMQALKELKKLQRDRQIIIKPCDKGAGIIILPFDEYLRSCYEHLMSEQSLGKPYYSQVHDIALDKLKVNLTNVINEALEQNIITSHEYAGMNPEGKGAGRFYCNYKVHKEHDHKSAPPVRPITSQSGSVCEGIATYVEHHIKHMATEHDSYIQDTPDFLRIIQKVNRGPKLGENTLLVTMDVDGLYTNIKHDNGLKTLEEKLNKRKTNEPPTNFIIKLMKIILNENKFEFHDALFKQNIGASMGSKPIPHYANVFMAMIDDLIKNLDIAEALALIKRFLDDYFMLFKESTKSLHALHYAKKGELNF